MLKLAIYKSYETSLHVKLQLSVTVYNREGNGEGKN